MSDKTARYTPEFKRQLVDLARSGPTAASLSKEFGCSYRKERRRLSVGFDD